MSWINSRQFTISNRNGRHYVFRRNNAGNTEINIPANITTKARAAAWLAAHPNKVTAPNRFRPKRGRAPIATDKPWEGVSPSGRKFIRLLNKEGRERRATVAVGEPVGLLNKMRTAGQLNTSHFNCDSKKNFKLFRVIGRGRQGIAFAASRYANGRYPIAIKISPRDLDADRRRDRPPAQVEFDIQRAVMKVAPRGVVKAYQLLECENFIKPAEIDMANVQTANYDKARQSILFMEYCSQGSLAKWIAKQTLLTDTKMRAIISAVLKTLGEIRTVYPDFRHNDLHLDNVFVADRGLLIGDFGWARLEKSGTNPAVNTANGTKTASFWGVGPDTDARYDHHLFLNELRAWLYRQNPQAFPQTLDFLNRMVPPGYRGANDLHVTQWRLKYRDPCPDLPSFTKLIHDKYISGGKAVTSPMLMAARARLRPMGGAKPMRKPNAVYTNSQLINMSATNFIKLSPASKARAKVLRAGVKKAPNKPKAANKGKGPAPVRKRTPSPKRKPLPQGLLKSSKFNKMVNKIYSSQGGGANENFTTAWNRARRTAINRIRNRIQRNLAPFSASPPPKAPAAQSPRKKKKVNLNYKLSPGSGRVKIKAPASGRYVYANGSTITLEHLKNIAALQGVNIKGLRSKANIIKRIFSV